MTENAPPATAGTPNNDSSRGMPYYEKLRKDLRDALQRKRNLDQTIVRVSQFRLKANQANKTHQSNIEDSIFRTESSYLEETSSAGNIIKGFENYIKGTSGPSTSGPTGGTATRRKGGVTETDRIFSRSSASNSRDSPAPTINGTPTSSLSLAATPASGSHANTPGATGASAMKGAVVNGTGANKKKKAVDDADEDKPVKRGKISYGRD